MRSRTRAMKKAMAVGGGGSGKGGTAATDLLVCFPARQHLALMPKPICSPSRTTMDKAAAARRRQAASAAAGGGGRVRGSSPMFRGSKAKLRAEEEEEEPQSPKVTCAGQIKVGRPKKVKPAGPTAAAAKQGEDSGVGGARSWLTVAEEIDGRRKKVGWLQTLGIRRDALPFLGGALRILRFKARCFGFGSLHAAGAAAAMDSSVDSADDDGNVAGERGCEHGARGSAAASVFSKWLMVLEGGQDPLDLEQDETTRYDEERGQEEDVERLQGGETDEGTNGPSAPPPNALLLMRCRSAPAKGLSVSMSRRSTTCEQLAGEVVDQEKGAADGVPGYGETEEEDKEELVFMSTAPGFMKLSLDIAKETWIVGGGDPIARSRSWKR